MDGLSNDYHGHQVITRTNGGSLEYELRKGDEVRGVFGTLAEAIKVARFGKPTMKVAIKEQVRLEKRKRETG